MTRLNTSLTASALLLAGVAVSPLASAAEYPIGHPQQANGIEVGAVYLQPVIMEPAGGLPAKQADVHLEADIMALEDNPNGLPAGAWVPYLTVDYKLTREGSDATMTGTFMPMVASDGTHYGANVKLDGPGKYHLEYTIHPPTYMGKPFMRHVDRDTGVAEWFEPFTLEYDFVFAGTGKKGGY
ncbi:iron transporter [Marinobacter koreensis]|uniref:Iron transporter n=1 Tax=Marinobacter koreensis TaxID=335974 RepID=A0ABW0RG20_9GAMM|nr:iron transporter [Marinobacter koreensis]MCK7548195.1 iron transporter [Marinobacter koreensis]